MPHEWVAALVVVAVAAMLQGTVGMGYAIVTVPILAVIGPAFSPVPTLITMLPLAGAMAWKEWASADIHGLGPLILPRFPGAVVGVGLLAVATRPVLDVAIGLMVLAAVAVLAAGVKIPRTRLSKIGAGLVSGVSSAVSSIGGPPTALLYSTAEASEMRATLAVVFAAGTTSTLIVRAAAGFVTLSDISVSARLMPAMIVGWTLSLGLRRRVRPHLIRSGVLTISAVAAFTLIIKSSGG